ncbi:2-amino-4-hydroxy-6-hydroxymethyldihydropteridine diphosphokinase [Lysobacter pythonis]|uniref:2-amino-4-hydroxy-6-hydroxymethyldihydropteridine pyrophosphokinase n=1 Tax=Solilutibacter pythonis TaxID=2483112 RepID=A0A3M2I1F1_9GAMM|nr:2-amino-4-hydroxy-6-hydroxymethyldihydropteridine diphosphokinase [Lysobacter pythonis]RMH93012.1 2-amino-4-hydroxy-6-hydroxymethyldihydropteridine diphosphokinase [Lysobacter pythonis]
MNAPVTAFVGLGGNIGDVEATLRAAFGALGALPETRLVAASSLYRSVPVGGVAQADFVNAAAKLETTLTAPALLRALLAVESAHGRDRARERRWGPRTLDLDLLMYGDAVIEADGLDVPHPRMAERAFVLLPLADIAAEARIPGLGPVCEALAALGPADRLGVAPIR